MSATNTDNVIPGNALAVQGDRPFGSLQKFGSAFLTKFEAAEVCVPAASSASTLNPPPPPPTQKQKGKNNSNLSTGSGSGGHQQQQQQQPSNNNSTTSVSSPRPPLRAPGEILRKISFVDTPGILSGDKQSKRNYDFTSVIDWFAGRCDRILLLFDCHKLDISNEFQHAIEALKGERASGMGLVTGLPATDVSV